MRQRKSEILVAACPPMSSTVPLVLEQHENGGYEEDVVDLTVTSYRQILITSSTADEDTESGYMLPWNEIDATGGNTSSRAEFVGMFHSLMTPEPPRCDVIPLDLVVRRADDFTTSACNTAASRSPATFSDDVGIDTGSDVSSLSSAITNQKEYGDRHLSDVDMLGSESDSQLSPTSSGCSRRYSPNANDFLHVDSSYNSDVYAQTPEVKLENDVTTNNGKGQPAGFQSGVTVGYTYETFIATDGRSRRRKVRPDSGVETAAASATTAPREKEVLELSHDSHQQQQQQQPVPVIPRYTCTECGRHYATSSNLSRHKQTHRSLTGRHAKTCPYCNKPYVSMPALAMHLLTHDLKYRCPVCDKAFSRPWLLRGHQRSHTGEKPFGCAHCGKAFADRSNLRAHMQTHSAVKSFQCPRCLRQFALKSYLNKHLNEAATMTPSSLSSATASTCCSAASSSGAEMDGGSCCEVKVTVSRKVL